MSRLNVRRLTAGLLLAALLGLAAPASAAPPGWSLPTVALGPAWVEQVLEWLRSLLPGEGKDPARTPESDVSSTADPNG
jgi:hypothetical protein